MPDVITHPHIFAWYSLVSKFSKNVSDQWKAAVPAKAKKEGKKGKKGGPKAEEPKKKEETKKEEDEMDLFGSDDDDEASFDALCKAKQAAIDKANSKKKAIAKSIILWEVKPLDSETNLDTLCARIMANI